MKFGRYILFVGFLLIIFSLGTLSFFAKDHKVSDLENRKLAQKPVKDPKLIWSGKYFKQYESYFSDQFIGRDRWVAKYTQLKLKTTPVYVNGYHLMKDNTILQKPTNDFPKKEIDWTARQVNDLGRYLHEKGTTLYYFSLPSKTNVFSDFLPSFAPNGRVEENNEYLLSQLNKNVVTTTNIHEKYKTFNEETIRSFYYKTDHHWNIKGAFPAYQMMMQTIEKDFPNIPRDYGYENYKYTESNEPKFMGSWNKQLAKQVNTSGEVVNYYEPKKYSFKDYKVYQAQNKKAKMSSSSVYGNVKHEKKETYYADIYTYDYREYTIDNQKSKNDLKVLIIKDSYMNAITFHMAHHFKQTTVFDIRHNLNRSLYDYLKTHEFDAVIIGYNDTFVPVKRMYDFSSSIKK